MADQKPTVKMKIPFQIVHVKVQTREMTSVSSAMKAIIHLKMAVTANVITYLNDTRMFHHCVYIAIVEMREDCTIILAGVVSPRILNPMERI